jgi:hypothetical protein
MNEDKQIELLMLMYRAGLIKLPNCIRTNPVNQVRRLGIKNKQELLDAILNTSTYGRSSLLFEPGIGNTALAEMCWLCVYGFDWETK